jgi:ABC-type transport system substrate-binding protein
VIPEVAAGFPRVSKDARTFTVPLKHTYRFHTGAPITAANFVAAFVRDGNPALKSRAVGYVRDFAGADALIAGKARTLSGVKALDRYTLQLRTTRPMHDLPARLTMPFFCPGAVDTPAQEVMNPLGSGPYYVASRVKNRQTVLERNRFYRGPRPAKVDRIVYSVGLGQEACRQAFERNMQDWCVHLSTDDYGPLEAKYGVNRPDGQFFFNPTFETDFFVFNHQRPAFAGTGQIALKQAINLVVDRPALVRAFGHLGARPTDQILPAALGRDEHIYPLSGVSEQTIARARALVAKARKPVDRLVLYTSDCPCRPFSTHAQIFQFDLSRLGIDVEIKYFPLATFFQKVETRGEPFDVAEWAWGLDYPDGLAFLGQLLDGRRLTDSSNSNVTYLNSIRHNREIDQADSLTGAARRRAWADLDAELMRDDPPWAPFANYAEVDLVSKSLGCYVFQPVIGRFDLVAACKK